VSADTSEQEIASLKRQVQHLEDALANAGKRLEELRKGIGGPEATS